MRLWALQRRGGEAGGDERAPEQGLGGDCVETAGRESEAARGIADLGADHGEQANQPVRGLVAGQAGGKGGERRLQSLRQLQHAECAGGGDQPLSARQGARHRRQMKRGDIAHVDEIDVKAWRKRYPTVQQALDEPARDGGIRVEQRTEGHDRVDRGEVQPSPVVFRQGPGFELSAGLARYRP